MTDIQSQNSLGELNNRYGPLAKSSSDITGNDGAVYTYIGITDPEAERSHVYENQSIVDAQKSKLVFDSKKHETM